VLAEVAKLIGNSLYGRFAMRRDKHTTTEYCAGGAEVNRAINNPSYKTGEVVSMDPPAYEVTIYKEPVSQNLPIQISCAVYSLAKLRMLEFYYDFLLRFVDKKDFEMFEMDTDSCYIMISGRTFEEIVKPDMREEYERVKYDWFPRPGDQYEFRRPLLFKQEYVGTDGWALCAKQYLLEDNRDDMEITEDMTAEGYPDELIRKTIESVHRCRMKCTAKGIQKRRNAPSLISESYRRTLRGENLEGENAGIRRDGQVMKTYVQKKRLLNGYYDKRVVQANGVDTKPPFRREWLDIAGRFIRTTYISCNY
jgi:hypothetical protein